MKRTSRTDRSILRREIEVSIYCGLDDFEHDICSGCQWCMPDDYDLSFDVPPIPQITLRHACVVSQR